LARLVSINIGAARPIPGTATPTGIYKTPATGPIAVGVQGLAGDVICDREHHGGADQAVYVYFSEDYDWWAPQMDMPPEPGLFGENLTISGTDSARTAIGDRFTIGELVLEVTYHRTPCMTFAARMGDPKWVKRFHRGNRPGAYCRVITPGTIQAGMEIAVTPFAGERVTVTELMALDGAREIDPAFMRRALATPIRHKTRFKYENSLASLF